MSSLGQTSTPKKGPKPPYKGLPYKATFGLLAKKNKRQTKTFPQINAFCRTHNSYWSTMNALFLFWAHLSASLGQIPLKKTLDHSLGHFAKTAFFHFSLLLKSLVSPCKRSESAQIVFSGPNNPRTAINAQPALTEGRPATGLRAHFGLSECLLVISIRAL